MIKVNARIEKVSGGASAIATMTFDDGLRETAMTLNELCKKYDSRASLMLCSGIRIDTSLDMWRSLFAEGYLHPESHSHLHKYLTRSHPENLTEEIISDEIEGSLKRLNELLPGYDILTFGIPYSSYAEPAREHLYKSFYMVRSGSCVLADESARGKMQLTDPPLDRGVPGSLYSPYVVRMMPEKSSVYPMITPDAILDYLDRCVRDGGWFISVAHGIVEGENLDIKVCDLEKIMKRMKEHKDRGALWITTLTDAIKYIRERASATLESVSDRDGEIALSLYMNDTTDDGLPLPAEVFNYPLTVAVELSNAKDYVSYTLDGKCVSAPVIHGDGGAFARIEMRPNTKTTVIIN